MGDNMGYTIYGKVDTLEEFEELTKEDKIEDAMMRASIKVGLTRNQLLDILFEKGVLAVYHLGMKHMYEYLEK